MSGIMLAASAAVAEPRATLSNAAYSRITNTSSFSLKSDGTLAATNGGAESTQYTYMLTGFASQVEAKVDPISGTYSTGTTGTWLNLGTTRQWTLNWPGGMASVNCQSTVTIRDAATLATLATATITIISTP